MPAYCQRDLVIHPPSHACLLIPQSLLAFAPDAASVALPSSRPHHCDNDRRCIVLAIDRIYHPAMHPCFRPSSVSLPHLVFTYHRAPSLLYSPLHLVYTVQSTHLLFDFALYSRCLHRHIYVSFYPAPYLLLFSRRGYPCIGTYSPRRG